MKTTYKTASETAEITRLQKLIAELEASDRVLVGTDEGTHGGPRLHRIYETITGERYATASFGGANATRCTEESAIENTDGRIVKFSEATAEIRANQAALRAAKKSLAKLLAE